MGATESDTPWEVGLRGVEHLDPLRAPTHLRLSQKPKFVVFFFKPSLIDFSIYNDLYDMGTVHLYFGPLPPTPTHPTT